MNIYVGNIDYEISEEELEKTFEQFGTVESVKILRDSATRLSRGYGFVEMSPAEGTEAIRCLNGKRIQGRPLKVREAK